MHGYGRFLAQERGLSQVTLGNYLPVARRFLSKVFGTKAVDLDELAAGDVNGFILHDRSTLSPKRVQLTASALRSFLGFLYLRGQLAIPLAASVPSVATWRLSDLPQFLEPEQVQRLLQSCQRSSPCGRRDYAALLLLARLGLRAGEVVHLCLEDINWNCRRSLDPGQKFSRGSPAAATRCGSSPGHVFAEGAASLFLSPRVHPHEGATRGFFQFRRRLQHCPPSSPAG